MKNIYRLENKLKKKTWQVWRKLAANGQGEYLSLRDSEMKIANVSSTALTLKPFLKRPNYLVESITFKLPHLIFLFHDIFISFLNLCVGIGGK